MKRYIIYDLEENRYYTEDYLCLWSEKVKQADKYKNITEAQRRLYKLGFPSGIYQIIEIYVKED